MTDPFKLAGDISATVMTVAIVVDWLTAISLILTIGWWLIRACEWWTGKSLPTVIKNWYKGKE